MREASLNVTYPTDISLAGMKAAKNDENYNCDKVDYPTFQQVADLVNQLDISK